MNVPPTNHDATPRRGMLLLLVLSILALFIVVGGVGILLALRAREAARAFAAASASQATSGPLARAQLDEALLRLVRGTNPVGGPVAESLLADKYGSSQSGTGTVTAVSSGTSTLITVTLAGSFTDTTTGSATTVAALLANPAAVAGRVFTFVPAANDPTGPTSYRILRTGTTANTLLLANVKPNTPLALPSIFPCGAVINGREFSGTTAADKHEPYDAFDDQNPFLTQAVLERSTVASVARPAFGAAGARCAVDNDGDGVPDGVWLEDALPRQRTAGGGDLKFDVSYLVLDLDGRINVNAHGSFVRVQTARSTSTYPKDPATVPPGLGYGPADVDAALLVASGSEVQSGAVPARWVLMTQGGTVPGTATTSSTTQWRPAPRVETVHPGRYGYGPGSAQPGGSTITGTNALHSDAWMVGNSPTDLKARLQVFTEGSPPTLAFSRPSPAWAASDTDDVLGAGAAAHPYRMRLDEDAPRDPARVGVGTASDVVFTVGELERVLRQFDTDASTLAPRLAAMLDDLGERSRMTVTTDSWDTPAITGVASGTLATTAAAMVAAGGNLYAVHSPEVVAGLRFNLNRPLVSGSARQDYFRQLYTLVVSLTGAGNADAAAQWVANVIEFRDPDSIMTWYPYDPNPLDGVWTTGTGVWGIERPEMVITSAPPPTGGATDVRVGLYRPWGTKLCVGTSTTASGTTERIDASLGDQAANTLDVTRVAGGSAVWRVRIVNGGTAALNNALTTATAVAANSAVGGTVTVALGTGTQVELQRLADPTVAENAALASGSNQYVTIHAVPVPPGKAGDTVSRWLHWPNRDFVSHGELLTVPSGAPGLVPEALFSESRETSLARSFPLILDATIVPSRFVGANVSVASGTTHLAGTGYQNFQYGQLSRWREPGRVNVNTILANTGNTPASLDNAVRTALVGPNPGANAFTVPVKADRDLLVVGGDAVFPRSTADAASGFLKRATAIRLANVATTRSHVFAVWITLRITETSPTAGSPQYVRLFAIVDRSLPVGYAPGRNLNVREAIRLQRFLP